MLRLLFHDDQSRMGILASLRGYEDLGRLPLQSFNIRRGGFCGLAIMNGFLAV